ncbi:MAG: FAD-binding protein, partial [Flavobacteriales bacterium]|nr:FAD-binding protein [Flavobacteriales bacterium]
NSTGKAVYLDFKYAIQRYGGIEAHQKGIENPTEQQIYDLGKKVVEEKYGNLFQMYEMITDDDPYVTPMMIYPAVHYTMGGIWVDYELMTTIKGCYALGECNFSDHGANRLGASALMQGLADGYYVLPNTISNYLADEIHTGPIPTTLPEFDAVEKDVKDRIEKLMSIKGTKSVDSFSKRLGNIMWNKVGMGRTKQSLTEAIEEIRALRAEFWKDLFVPGEANALNPELEKAGRVADFMELGQLMAMDALSREESCGGHFREEHQTEDGEAKRDDENFSYVSAWQWVGDSIDNAVLHKEPLVYEETKVQQRSYK